MKKLTTALLTFAVTSSLLTAADKPLKVFVFAGQSNMVGKRSQVEKLPDDLKSEQKNVLLWHGGEWKSYTAGLGQKAGFGPEVSAGLELARAIGEPVGMIKHSVGGTNLHNQWNPENPKSLYGGLARLVAAAADSRPIEIVGMFWMQGESDTQKPEMFSAYSDNLDGLIAKARSDFKSPGMIFVCGRVNPEGDRFTGLETVRKAQEKERENYGWIDCDDLPKVGDKVHYDTPGTAEMGRRFARRYLSLAGSKPVTRAVGGTDINR